MNIRHEWRDGPEIIFIDGLSMNSELNEVQVASSALKDPKDSGSAEHLDGKLKKQNSSIFASELYREHFYKCSSVYSTVERILQAIKERPFTANSYFNYVKGTFFCDILFSAYANDDYYEPHADNAKLTMLMWLGERNFAGGDLYLPDFDYWIPYDQNKAFIFPSHYQHEVTPISTDQEGFVRYCASAFIN